MAKVIVKDIRVEQFTRKFPDPKDPGYTIKEDETYQRLVEIQVVIGRFRSYTRKKILDTIEVPQHVMISMACYGDTGGWVSPFAEYMK